MTAYDFRFFSKAILPLIQKGNPDIVHVNDWPFGYLFGYMEAADMLQTRVLSIHNIGYQGNIYKPWIRDWEMLELLKLARVGALFNDVRVNVEDSVNPLRLAMELAHAVKGRAVEQKVQLLAENLDGKPVLERLLDLGGINIAFLGTGDSRYEALFSNAVTSRWGGSLSDEKFLTNARRGNIISTVAFDRQLARQTWLASDGFHVPSLYEPCGITQMQSMELATPPLVRRTGGLADTIVPYGEPDATGFSFDGDTREGVLRALRDC